MRRVQFVVAMGVLLLSCSADDDPADVTPPGTIQDLVALESGARIRLTWTSPGDDGLTEGRASAYDVRYAADSLTDATWVAATPIESVPSPQLPGRIESILAPELGPGSWAFAIRTVDDAGNWSSLSNVATWVVAPDTIAPAAITDLDAAATSTSSIRLTWTAPGSDGTEGQAAAYDLRFDRSRISEETWQNATAVESEPAPKTAGSGESFEVGGLEAGALYHFAIRASDRSGNVSGLSNIALAATATPGLRQVTFSTNSIGAGSPDWSPDGTTLLFSADWDRWLYQQIYSISPFGGTATRITSFPEGTHQGAWSPDGKRIGFVLNVADYPYTYKELWVMDASGANPRQVAGHGQQAIHQFAWAPDGTRIAYTVSNGPPPFGTLSVINVVLVDGGSPTLLWDPEGSVHGLDWSPDGSKLVVSVRRNGGDADLYVYSVGDGSEDQLTNEPSTELAPAWSPDGGQIAFASDRSGNYDLWIMPADGGIATQLTVSEGWESSATWSPEGNAIAYHSWRPDEQIGDIWVLPLD